jgi:hypothetical protein
VEPELEPEAAEVDAEAAGASLPVEAAPETVAPVSAAPGSPATAASVRATGAARALQQQGVRRRREIDPQALADYDSRYAKHELRRIVILATMVIVTLIVLGIVLR